MAAYIKNVSLFVVCEPGKGRPHLDQVRYHSMHAQVAFEMSATRMHQVRNNSHCLPTHVYSLKIDFIMRLKQVYTNIYIFYISKGNNTAKLFSHYL